MARWHPRKGAAVATVALAAAVSLSGITSASAKPAAKRYTCDGKRVTILVTGRSATGTPKRDVILVLNGKGAHVDGGGGNDVICGGSGNDTLLGGAGNDTILGGGGNDRIDGGPGNDVLHGDSGNDTITTGAGSDKAYGDAGNDTITGGGGTDRLDGGDGNDILVAYAGGKVAVAAHLAAAEHFPAALIPRVVPGATSTTSIFGGGGTDTMTCGVGKCIADGGAGTGTVTLGSGRAVISHVSTVVLGSGPAQLLTPGRIVLTSGHGTLDVPVGTTFVTPAGVPASAPAGSVVGGVVTQDASAGPDPTPAPAPPMTYPAWGAVADAGSGSVAGIPVYVLDRADRVVASATTASDGSYSFTGLPGGTGFTIVANTPLGGAYNPARSTESRLVDFPADAYIQPTLTLRPAATITGQVTLDDGTTPVPQAFVSATDPAGDFAFAQADSSGAFVLGGLTVVSSVTYSLRAGSGNLEPTSYVHVLVSSAVPYVAPAPIELQHPATGPYRVLGTLVDSVGNGVDNTDLTLHQGSDSGPVEGSLVTTDQDGLFEFPSVPNGPYVITGTTPGSVGSFTIDTAVTVSGADRVVTLRP